MQVFRGQINILQGKGKREVQLVSLEKRRWRECVSFLAAVLCSVLQGEHKQPNLQVHGK